MVHDFWTNHKAKLCKILIWIPFDTQLKIVPLVYPRINQYTCLHTALFLTVILTFFPMASFFHLGFGPLYIKALALRGTLYTLISKVDEAIHDLSQVINADDKTISTKVDFQP